MLERYWFALLAPLLGVLALTIPLHLLLASGLLVETLQVESKVGGVRMDPTDLVVAAMLLAIFVRTRNTPSADPLLRRSLRLWLGLGVLLSISYLVAPVNQTELTGPVRIVYQIVRYCWKPIAFFPLTLLLMRTPAHARTMIVTAVLTADIFALQAIQQGYRGAQGTGPFATGNELGGAMIVPTVFALAGLVSVPGRSARAFFGLSLLLMARAILFAGSRGGFVAVFAGIGVFTTVLLTLPAGRRRMIRLGAVAVLLFLGLLLLKPDLAARPSIQKMTSITEGTQVDTFQWRLSERWPHFLQRAFEHPIFGYGTAADPSLSTAGGIGNTPHNGYLSLAVTYGFPILFLFLLFALLAVRNSFRLMRHSSDPERRVLGLALVAAMVGVLCHNVIESTLSTAFVAKLFWIICALSSAALRWPDDEPREEPLEAPSVSTNAVPGLLGGG